MRRLPRIRPPERARLVLLRNTLTAPTAPALPAGLAETVRTMAERVSVGDWLHIFPEGRVSPPDEKQGELGRLKWGLGKMLCDVHELGGPPPVVLPFWHTGMERVKPYGVGVLRAGERIHVTVGEPIDFGDLVRRCGRCGTEKKKERLFREMMSRVEEKMLETRARNLRERAEREHEKEKDKGA